MIINFWFTNFKQAIEYTVNNLASKCRSKNEFYNVLSRDGNAYLPLPKIQTKSIWGLS